MLIRISARSSFLARYQALQVGDALRASDASIEIEYFFRESLGDKNLTDPLWKMPEKGVFTEDFLEDLLHGKTDLVVHSWKDLPTERKPGTDIVATLPRADQRDLLLVKKTALGKIQQSKQVSIFSSSLRRQKNLTDFLSTALPSGPHQIQFRDVRGNIPTRISKLLNTPDADGLVLAKAALDRLLSAPWPDFQELKRELQHSLSLCEWMVLPLSKNPNAAAQGALAIEIKSGRTDLEKVLSKINHPETFQAVQTERQILAGYGGGCHQKIGIAVLPRPFGEIHFLQGLTDQGQILDSSVLLNSPALQDQTKAPAKKWSSSQLRPMVSRAENPYSIAKNVNAVYVSRISAWRPHGGYIWAAGLETWKQLAATGVWVHGSSEGLGESEEPAIDVLAQVPLNWARLTHADAEKAATEDHKKIQNVATYKMNLDSQAIQSLSEQILGAQSFFWTSAYHFDRVTEQFPEILSRTHASGPGKTWLALKERLKQKGLSAPQVYLSEAEWRK